MTNIDIELDSSACARVIAVPRARRNGSLAVTFLMLLSDRRKAPGGTSNDLCGHPIGKDEEGQ
ncbi:hypothetical protein [Phytohabitans aurantiacus]|uniref:hypothetical protein n=1 Tax=Phytohabitans aurantiacus TaxID=3016789 RepID=UPI0024934F35|nr:hypothetical protein [Phytohabitans aurantiacus]